MDDKIKTLIEGLNEDLSYEYAAVITYTYNASTISGLSRPILKDFFEAEAQDELKHARYLSEKIAALGGKPLVKPAEVKQAEDVRTMLENAIAEEGATIERYVKRIDQAEAAGQYGLKVELEDMLADESNHKEEMQRLLQDPRLS
ncbi:ferritin-like domain-containing protein [Marininema halotolerans]|uniref:Bacterioferritin n=1 Tax=Marininema halotolerans TaxID=1155944 RepID=A0A1I6SK13_9BACL|nr:ferritin-like domain-containing protein [Marininema halotolerans]SFS77302.1 bacterioferritin [Marininema halotolerans]